ncbi:response regulator transcription factor [Cysteiniphilum sp. QT6929]|uniref:response regulator transcription factor n=1 Tax=Cysteiniphilum TaxID=2056696 RepID=UPI0024B36AB6|nr:response regulator transcription factor [Cysteiniphilum sp. QT6929]WHN64693.1 response regulator transcription factor [Cysteiniphilum sp. QT6929]
MHYKVLYVEDDLTIAEIVKSFMQQKLIDIKHFNKAQPALIDFEQNSYQLVILDLNLPDIYGLDVCKQMRLLSPKTPILILSANIGETNRIIGLESGANDYLEKPFNLHELYARIKNLIQFSSKAPSQKKYQYAVFNCLQFNLNHKTLSDEHGKKDISLTKAEASILDLLISRQNQLISKYDIAEILGLTDQADSRSVDQLIGRIRKKINDPTGQIIRTIRGHGYIFLGSIQFK